MSESVPPLYAQMLQRARAGELAPRQAIKAFCLSCTGYVRSDVANCTSRTCVLHTYRPYQAKKVKA